MSKARTRGRRGSLKEALPGERRIWLLSAAVGVGLLVSVGLVLPVTDQGILHAPGGPLVTLGRVTGLAGTYLLLITLLFIGRLPLIERMFGQDKLLRVHRWFGPAILILLSVHVLALAVGYGQQLQVGPLSELWDMIVTLPGILMSTVGIALLLMAGITSYRRLRRRLHYETWWVIHLYTYIGVALSFTHQLSNGAPFLDHPVARAYWIVLWALTAGVVILFRWVLPIARTMYHSLRVVGVKEEAPGVVSVLMEGRHLDRLPAAGGQFLQWRFLRRDIWWMAHPYSLSALPKGNRVRITVKAAGRHSSALASLPSGTRVAIEGPYGAFTPRARQTDRVLLIAAGVGITPIRTILEDLPSHVDVVTILRGSSAADLPLRDEIAAFVASHGGRLHEIVGPRSQAPLNQSTLRQLVPDISGRDVYLCGPNDFMLALKKASRALGVPRQRIHRESFAF